MPFLRSLVVAMRVSVPCLWRVSSTGVNACRCRRAAQRTSLATARVVLEIARWAELSAPGPSVRSMKTTGTERALRVVRPDETAGAAGEARALEGDRTDYWSQVQALRDDLARLRPAN